MQVAKVLTALGASAFALGTAAEARQQDFALSSTGAIAISATGSAEFGIVAGADGPFFSMSLGSAHASGAVVLSRGVAAIPVAGNYAITGWDRRDNTGRDQTIQAVFFAGSPTQPLGVFAGYAGKVRISETRPGRIDGTFTIKARGFLATDPDRDNLEVVIHGTFTAWGEQTVAVTTSVTGISP